MSDIFLSYASPDRNKAKLLADLLASQGWSVWWDRTILPGSSWSQVIEKELECAKCVVVLWSQVSVESEWVKGEAAEGARRKILVPAVLDEVRIPLEFRRVQAADLSDWQNVASHDELIRLIKSVEILVPRGSRNEPILIDETASSVHTTVQSRSAKNPQPASTSTPTLKSVRHDAKTMSASIIGFSLRFYVTTFVLALLVWSTFAFSANPLSSSETTVVVGICGLCLFLLKSAFEYIKRRTRE